MIYYQQGDVLLKPIKCVPTEATAAADSVLAYGEATGHSHRLVGDAMKLVVGTAIYARVLEECRLLHEEHKALVVPPGEYQVDFVREYDHFNEEARRVMD